MGDAPGLDGPDDDPLEQPVVAVALSPTPARGSPALLLVLSLALYVVTAGGDRSPLELAALIGVLLFHELGHLLGMRAFGYGDVRMFFIPFLGAAVSGRSEGVAPWKRGVVLLLGPLPGLVVASGLVAGGAAAHPFANHVATMLLVVNGLNLLPFEPLDGGQLWRLTLFSRHAWLELLAALVSGLGLVGLGIKLGTVVLPLVGLFVIGGVVGRRRFLAAATALRARFPAMSPRLAEVSAAELRALFLEARALGRAGSEPSNPTRRVRSLAATLRNLHDRVTTALPSPGQSAALLALGVGGVIASGPAAVVLAARGVTIAPGWAPGAREPLTLVATSDDGLFTAHYPGSFHHKHKGQLMLVRRLARGQEEVLTWTSRASLPGETARELVEGLVGRGGTPDAQGAATCHGEEGYEVRWRKPLDGTVYEERACGFLRGGRALVVLTIVPADMADAEGPVLREIADATALRP
jgi:Zn-dependent protease